jgi:hypothetical protein
MMSTALTMLQPIATSPLTRLLIPGGAPATCAASASLLLTLLLLLPLLLFEPVPDSTTTAGPDFTALIQNQPSTRTDCCSSVEQPHTHETH